MNATESAVAHITDSAVAQNTDSAVAHNTEPAVAHNTDSAVAHNTEAAEAHNTDSAAVCSNADPTAPRFRCTSLKNKFSETEMCSRRIADALLELNLINDMDPNFEETCE